MPDAPTPIADELRELARMLLRTGLPAQGRRLAELIPFVVVLERHTCAMPSSVVQALNSGDGSYHP